MDPPTGASSHSEGLEGTSPAKIERPLPSVPIPHQALCTAITVGALRPRTQGAVVSKATEVWALLEWQKERTEHLRAQQARPGRGCRQGSVNLGPPGPETLT